MVPAERATRFSVPIRRVSVGWKLFEARKMSDVHSTGKTFSVNRSGYDRNDERMASLWDGEDKETSSELWLY